MKQKRCEAQMSFDELEKIQEEAKKELEEIEKKKAELDKMEAELHSGLNKDEEKPKWPKITYVPPEGKNMGYTIVSFNNDNNQTSREEDRTDNYWQK